MPDLELTRPSILIVGAGLGGLILGILLEKANVPYTIFERSAISSPIGSAISLSASVMPLFKQLGLYDELVAISKPIISNHGYVGEGNPPVVLDYKTGMTERFSFLTRVFARPALYELLLKQIPKHKIIYSKKMLSYQETEDGVNIHFSDNTSFEGRILIGADGANSAVRQNMYRQLEKKGVVLPASDNTPLKYSSISLVGQTKVLDPELYPILKSNEAVFDTVVSSNKPFTSVTFPTAQNTICWMVVEYLNKESSKLHDSFRNSEWGPEAAEEMAVRPEVREAVFPGSNMATMGDLIDLMPRELMSKLMLEQKMFRTWSSGRVGLIGDGAVNAMADAIVLSNYLETLHGNHLAMIENVFKNFKKERFEHAQAAVDASASTATTSQNGIMGSLVRAILKNAPKWLWYAIMAKAVG